MKNERPTNERKQGKKHNILHIDDEHMHSSTLITKTERMKEWEKKPNAYIRILFNKIQKYRKEIALIRRYQHAYTIF